MASIPPTRRFATTNVEGVILPPPLSESHAILAELDAVGIPVVTVAMGFPRPGSMNVRIDDCAAAAEMTRHLLDLGHRNIGFIRGHPNHLASHERARGFALALKEYGINPAEAAVEQGYFTFRSGLVAAERLLARRNPPTAIFASNDDMAAAAVSVMHRRGLSVPGDISVVGFDDTLIATTIWPELTTVKQPIAAMAEAALDILLSHVRHRRGGSDPGANEQVLGHEMIVRESSGTAPSAAARARDQAAAPAPPPRIRSTARRRA